MLRALLVHLLIWPAILALSSADYYIDSLPGLSWPDNSLKMHSGHIVLDADHHGEMFFWHIRQKHLADRQRTIIWLNGGPGCSSMDGLFLEIGPFRFQDANTLVENEGSWHEFANVLFVDQPLGTGFSFIDSDHYITELDQMAEQMMHFLDRFLELFPEYANDDFYIAGESYAGQYIPYIAKAMLDAKGDWSSRRVRTHCRRDYSANVQNFNLKGLLIGNGWIDPMAGYQSYLPMMVETGLIAKDSEQYREVSTVVQECLKAESLRGVSIHISECEAILSKVFDVTLTKDAAGINQCINGYDYSLKDGYPSCGMSWPSELDFMTPYLRREDVRDAIHASDKILGWTECSGNVGASFRARNSRPSAELLPALLEKVPIVLFSGDRDIICNHLSTEMLIDNLSWNGDKGFGTEEPQPWVFQGADAGYYQSARNLTYILYHNASHMVPYDFARRSRDMVDRFMGINLSAIGGQSSDTTIGGATSDTPTSFEEATEKAEEKLKEEQTLLEKYKKYYKSGAVALVVVILAVCALVIFIWKHKGSIRRRYGFDKLGLQEAGQADETELEELTLRTPLFDSDNFDIGSDEEANDDSTPRPSRPNTPAASGTMQGSKQKQERTKESSRRHND
ncbi:Putative uncharacterized protein [Taphrina deformans PYCC 5710]|uniref:Carboxypeptidase n=1 Tax=Taphrina deformans (strain PYCC 5710 / ATCC 11124 / CBS 356.35 / IMI 108563 / JCM 9778 / NBRC 8474) TaxID=1097556 RepID=R4XDK4_TAPDE|nr:Putative uncharacterized protein [Taphrina deformans PYCC 5710]|eukprot:CCG82488.1 Putative uncharacterized protein [Taphrina deformans PYCC 5710]